VAEGIQERRNLALLLVGDLLRHARRPLVVVEEAAFLKRWCGWGGSESFQGHVEKKGQEVPTQS